jgi:hypothetical protein
VTRTKIQTRRIGTAWGSFLESGLTFQGKPTSLDAEFNRGRPRDPRTGRFVS